MSFKIVKNFKNYIDKNNKKLNFSKMLVSNYFKL